MLSLAWLTVFIIFVYVPGSTLNVIESSPSLLLSGSDSETKSETSAALLASSLVRSDDFANEKQFLRDNNKAAEINTIITNTATTTTTNQPTLASDRVRSIKTKDPSQSPSSSSSFSSNLLKIQLTQATPSTTATATDTTTRTTPEPWNILYDIGDRNNNERGSSIRDYGHSPPSSQKLHQESQLALSLSSSLVTHSTTTPSFPPQLTETIQNTARVIIHSNSFNRESEYASESPAFASARPEVSTRPPLSATLSSTSQPSFLLSLSAASFSSASSPTASSASSSSSTTNTITTTSSTTTLSPSLSSLDGYLNITSQAGTHAYLPCNVKQLVKKPISWLRVRDGHILTVDQTTFIADQRFQSIYTPNPERWSLQIKYVQTKDAGTYECQVSTEPKTSAIVSLNIVEPKTELIGESNRHVKAGSQVKLRCIISQALEPPLFINWYHNRKQIYLHNRKGWRTEIERDAAGNATTDKQSTIASLIIPSVGKKDSGNYTCSPSNSEPITVVLHVLNGEYSASAITSGSSSSSIRSNDIYHTLLRVISFLICLGQLRHPHSRLLPQDITRD